MVMIIILNHRDGASHVRNTIQDTNKTRFCVHYLSTLTFERRMKEKKYYNILIIKVFYLFCCLSALTLSDPAGVLHPTLCLTFSISYKNSFANSTYFAADRFLLVAAVYILLYFKDNIFHSNFGYNK